MKACLDTVEDTGIQEVLYDVIIIGGGLSGLMAGATLARRNKKVIVIEKNPFVGGLSSGFRRKGYYFDSAMARFAPLNIKGFLEKLGIYEKMDIRPHKARFNIKGHTFAFENAGEAFRGFAQAFPDEESQIMKFYDECIKDTDILLQTFYTVGSFGYSGWKMVKNYIYAAMNIPSPKIRSIKALMNMPSHVEVDDLLKNYFDENSEAGSFLASQGQNQRYPGMNVFFYTGAMFTYPNNKYPYKGFQSYADEFRDIIISNGSSVLTSTEVKNVIIDNKKCQGVEIKRGDKTIQLLAKKTVSAIDMKKLVFHLIGEEHVKKEFAKKLKVQKTGCCIPVLYLGVDIPGERIRESFGGSEEFVYVPAVKMLADDPSSPDNRDFYKNSAVTLHASCIHNPDHAPENKTNLQIYLSYPPENWLYNWGIKDNKRTDEYKEIKKMVIEQILDVVEEIIPELKDRSKIEVCELATPFTYERYTGNSNGSAVGFTWEKRKNYVNKPMPGSGFVDHITGIKNLYLIGHYTGYTGGTVNALISGERIGRKI